MSQLATMPEQPIPMVAPPRGGLDLTPANLRRNIIEPALSLRRRVTQASAESIRMYHGAHAGPTGPSDQECYESHNAEWVANIVPHCIMFNPKVKYTEQGGTDEATAIKEAALNSLIQQVNLRRPLEACAYDLQFDFFVMLVHLRDTPGHINLQAMMAQSSGQPAPPAVTPQQPYCTRISPRMYFRDVRTPEFGRPRAEGHMLVKYKSEMIAETVTDETGAQVSKYNAAAVAALTPAAGLTEMRSDLMQDGIVMAEDDRDLVVIFEVCCAELGLLLSIGFNDDGATFLREEREYKGPDSSPYVLGGIYLIPDQVYPLAPLAVTRRQVEELNQHKGLLSRDAGTAKRISVIGAMESGIIGTIQDAPSGSIVSAPGFNGQHAIVDMGGPNPATYEHVTFLEGKLDRTSGLSEMQRGNLTGVTAQEAAQAAGFVDVRIKYIQSKFFEATQDMLGKMAGLMDRTEVEFPVTIRDPQSGQMMDVTYHGEPVVPSPTYPWQTRPNVTIEPYTMEYVNQRSLREQMIETQAQVNALVEAGMTNPALKVREQVNDLLQTLNVSGGADRYVDWKLYDALRGMQLEMQMEMGIQGATGTGPDGKPVQSKGKPGKGHGDNPESKSDQQVGNFSKKAQSGQAA